MEFCRELCREPARAHDLRTVPPSRASRGHETRMYQCRSLQAAKAPWEDQRERLFSASARSARRAFRLKRGMATMITFALGSVKGETGDAGG